MGSILSSGALLAAEGGGHKVGIFGLYTYLILTFVIIFGLMAYARPGLKQRVFKNFVLSCFEQVYLFVEAMCISIIGLHGRRYIPFIMGLWLVIFTGNLMSLFFAYSPTSSLSFNLGLAFMSVFYVQYEGIKAQGFFGHFRHFAGPKLGLALVPVTIMIFLIEIMSELMKNVSLSLRLFGNINGGHQAVEAMNHLGRSFLVPLGEFLLPIKLLTVVVQALLFTLLTCVYLSLVTHHESEHPEESHEEAEGAPMAEHLSPA